MEYCGIKTSNIKASTKSSRSKTGKEMKPRRSHSRRRCYKTDDKSLNTTECIVGKSSRCVIRGNNPQLLEKRRSQNRNMYVIRSRDGKNTKSIIKNLPVVAERATYNVSRKPVVLESKMPVTPVVLESKMPVTPVVLESKMPVTPVVVESQMPVTPVVEEPLKNTPSPKVRKGRSVSPKSKSSGGLSMGPYVFNFVADTNFPKKKGSKETTLSKVQKYYNDIITKNKTNPNYKNIDTFNVDSLDETEYKGTLTLNDPPTSIKELNLLIENILSPDFILDSSDIHIFPDYIEDSLELDGQKVNQAGGRKKLLRH